MADMDPGHILKGRTFSFRKMSNCLNYRCHAYPARNFSKHFVLFYVKIFPVRNLFSFFFGFAPDHNLIKSSRTRKAVLH